MGGGREGGDFGVGGGCMLLFLKGRARAFHGRRGGVCGETKEKRRVVWREGGQGGRGAERLVDEGGCRVVRRRKHIPLD